MVYVMSDLHGCYDEYLQALSLIQFNENDQLYVLGDVIDRGKEPIRLLQDMMMRSNVFPIIGNHEYMAQSVLRRFYQEITEDNVQTYLKENDMENLMHWCQDGGETTLNQFCALSREQQEDILDYLDEFTLYEEVKIKNETYVLVHAGLTPFDEKKPLDEYRLEHVIFTSPDYQRIYYHDKYLVSGHRPTIFIDNNRKGEIIEMNRHIALDCGCVFGFNLGVYCLDTHEKFYVAYKK